MKVLFVMEKWCDGNPNLGLTNNFHNLLGSYKCAHSEYKIDVLFIDEVTYKNLHANIVLPQIKEGDYDYIIFSFLGDSHFNPSVGICNVLGERVKLCFMWPDTGYLWAQKKIQELNKFVHISWGGELIQPLSDKHLFLWAPEDESLYYPDEKEYEVTFVGSLRGYSDRKDYLEYLKSNNVNVKVDGGQRENKLSFEDYAKLIRRSKIVLNFCESPSGKDQMKGRCLEAIASKSLLLEKANGVTSKYLIPGKDYVEFYDKEDLKSKIIYYLENPSARDEISRQGYDTYLQRYSAKHFWNKVEEILHV